MTWLIESISIADVIDILMIAVLFWGMFYFLRRTRILTLFLGGVAIVVGCMMVASIFNLKALYWFVSNGHLVAMIGIPLAFAMGLTVNEKRKTHQ